MVPGDLWKFWEETRAKLAEVELNARVEPVEDTDVFTMEGRIKTRTIYRVIMSSFEGNRIRALAALAKYISVYTNQPLEQVFKPPDKIAST